MFVYFKKKPSACVIDKYITKQITIILCSCKLTHIYENVQADRVIDCHVKNGTEK